MSRVLIAAACSLEAKANASKAQANSDTDEALASGNTEKLRLATMEAMRATIYREVAASLREAAEAA